MQVALERTKFVQIFLYSIEWDLDLFFAFRRKTDGILLLMVEGVGETQGSVYYAAGIVQRNVGVVFGLVVAQADNAEFIFAVIAEDAADVARKNGDLGFLSYTDNGGKARIFSACLPCT